MLLRALDHLPLTPASPCHGHRLDSCSGFIQSDVFHPKKQA